MIKGLPERLKKLRQKYHFSQKEVAERLGISPSIVSGYETGERTPSAENLLALSYLYRCSTDYLLGRDTSPPSVLSNTNSPAFLDVNGLSEKQITALAALVKTMK